MKIYGGPQSYLHLIKLQMIQTAVLFEEVCTTFQTLLGFQSQQVFTDYTNQGVLVSDVTFFLS